MVVFNAYSLNIQDYLSITDKHQIELVDRFKFGKWDVLIIREDNTLKTVFIKGDTIKEFPEVIPEITDENYVRLQSYNYDYKIFPDGTIKNEINKPYPRTLKEKDYGNIKFILKKYSKGGLPQLYVKTPDIEKKIVEFNDFDFFKNDKYAYIFSIDRMGKNFHIYRLIPSKYLYDLEEIYRLETGFDYVYTYFYCDGNVFILLYNSYEPTNSKAYGLLFDVKNEKVKKLFQLDGWNKSKNIIGCVNKKIYIKEKFKPTEVYSLDFKPVKSKIVKLKLKGIKLTKKTLKIDGCADIQITDNYLLIRRGKGEGYNLYIFDRNFKPLKNKFYSDGGDIYFVDKDIYRYSFVSSCLFKIFPTDKQIKCSKTGGESIIPARKNSLIYHKTPYKTPFSETNGYLKIERNGKIIWERKLTKKDRIMLYITEYGILMDDIKNRKFYFLDLDGNKKLLNVSIKRLKKYNNKYFIYSDGNYFYKFDFKEERFKPFLKSYFLYEGKKVSCYVSQNIVQCGNKVYSFETGKEITEIKSKHPIFFKCYTNGYLINKEFLNNKDAILKFFKGGRLVDHMPTEKSSKIICLDRGFLEIKIKREGLSTSKCKTSINYYRIINK